MSIDASWIWVGEDWGADVQAGWFRRTFVWSGAGGELEFHLTADTRYRAWWNGRPLGRGPHCGDPGHWHYDTFAVPAIPGENSLAVEVLFQGRHEALKLAWLRPALLCWADDPAANRLVASGSRWKCLASAAHSARPATSQRILPGYTSLGAFEEVDLGRVPAGWIKPGFDDSGWSPAAELNIRPHRRDETGVQENSWELVPTTLPPLTEEPQPWRAIIRAGAILVPPPADAPLWQGAQEVPSSAIPPHDALTGAVSWEPQAPGFLIVDAGEMTTAFVELDIEAPAGTVAVMRYAESLSLELKKGRRDERGEGTVEGYFDRYTLREGRQTCEPFHWRPFRFLKLEVHGPCRVRAIRLRRCTYPGHVVAEFSSPDPVFRRIWDVSWRTAQLCAHDAHDDCPYYEQLPYIGDLRLHGPLGLMLTGDRRLFERSIRMYSWARRSDGMILTRYPARVPQIIPPFALIWIMLVEDYFLMTGDAGFVAGLFPMIDGILDWFQSRENEKDILVRPFPYWNFTDWSLPQDEGAEINAGNRASLIMFYAGALKSAARLAMVCGRNPLAFATRAESLRGAIRAKLWCEEDGLFRDDLKCPASAVHQTILGILYDQLDEAESHAALDRILRRSDLAQPTLPFLFYLFRAASKLGRYNDVWPRLSLWKDMLDLGATTWFEMPEPTRSDCHAWSSWIARDFLTEILGIQPLEPGYKRVLVRPRPADLPGASGKMPTPHGMVRVSWTLRDGRMEAEIDLPAACHGGLFIAPDGSHHALSPGKNRVPA
jgi:hypothetical protein